MSRIIAVDLVSVEVTRNQVVLHLKDSKSQRHTKSFPRADFEAASRPLAAGQPNVLVAKLGFRPDDNRLLTTLDDNVVANMGDARSHGAANDLIMLLMADKRGSGQLLRAMANGTPLQVRNPFRDVR